MTDNWKDQEVPVIFRIERRKGGQVTAVFPCEPADLEGNMTCYCHIGQHGACSFAWYTTGKHRAAKPEEYANLKLELESLRPYPYKLRVYQRLNSTLRKRFRNELDRLRRL